jgi:L-fuconolactonase
MLDFGIVDTHVHLWDVGRLRYPWLDDIPLLNGSYLPSDYRKAHGPIAVEKMVFLQAEVEPRQSLDEAKWVESRWSTTSRGWPGWCPGRRWRRVRRQPTLWDRLAEIPQVKGIRRIIWFEDDLEFCLRPGFVRGVRLLERYGFSFDICISHEHMANTITLVRRCPNI